MGGARARPEKGRRARVKSLDFLNAGVAKVVEIMSRDRGRLWASIALAKACFAVAAGIARLILSGDFSAW